MSVYNETQSIRIIVAKISFQGLSEDVDEIAGSRSCEGRAFQDNGPDQENARGPNVDVDVRGTNSLR